MDLFVTDTSSGIDLNMLFENYDSQNTIKIFKESTDAYQPGKGSRKERKVPTKSRTSVQYT